MKNRQQPFPISVTEISASDLRDFAEGWLLDGESRQHSRGTLAKRRIHLDKFFWFLKDREVATVTTLVLRQFLAYVANGHTDPGGRWGNPQEVHQNKPGTVAAFHSTLRCFLNWTIEEGGLQASPLDRVGAPIDRPDQIQPFTKEQIEALLQAARKTRQRRRNEAILLFLLDTGVRVTELCTLAMCDLDMKTRAVTVLGKGNKKRQVHFGIRTARSLWSYLREVPRPGGAPVFLGEGPRTVGEPMTRNGMLLLIRRLGRLAGITEARCSPHTFRHTFAVEFLRNGGNQFTLMHLLGHTDTKMTARYVAIAQADAARQHRQCSPVDRMWKTE